MALTAPVSTVVTTDAVVRGHALTKRYGEGPAKVEALRGVDVEFAHGTFTAIMGPSGSGKSTLMHILAGLDRPTEGWVEIDGTRLGELSDP
jgi:putative ABC transport system ATP-binding protein